MSLLCLVLRAFRGGVGFIPPILSGLLLLVIFGIVGFGVRLLGVSVIPGSSAPAILWWSVKKGPIIRSVSFLIIITNVLLVIIPQEATLVRR